jgi:hypothetical protein
VRSAPLRETHLFPHARSLRSLEPTEITGVNFKNHLSIMSLRINLPFSVCSVPLCETRNLSHARSPKLARARREHRVKTSGLFLVSNRNITSFSVCSATLCETRNLSHARSLRSLEPTEITGVNFKNHLSIMSLRINLPFSVCSVPLCETSSSSRSLPPLARAHTDHRVKEETVFQP